eukprot:144389-Ditylum_brightwellii.AAC.1
MSSSSIFRLVTTNSTRVLGKLGSSFTPLHHHMNHSNNKIYSAAAAAAAITSTPSRFLSTESGGKKHRNIGISAHIDS